MQQKGWVIVEKYLWQGVNTTLLAVYDGAENLLMRFRYADDRVPVSMNYGGATFYLLTDQVGTVRAVADSSGTIVKHIDYDSFGNVLADSNPSFPMPLGFAGGLQDRDLGLVRFGFRDYQSETSRWVAKDPIDFNSGDANLYSYTLGDPLNGVDPNGLSVQTPDMIQAVTGLAGSALFLKGSTPQLKVAGLALIAVSGAIQAYQWYTAQPSAAQYAQPQKDSVLKHYDELMRSAERSECR